MNWYSDYEQYTIALHEGREVRIWKGLPAHDALVSNPDALRNAAITADRMPFAFTANQGVVMADKIPA